MSLTGIELESRATQGGREGKGPVNSYNNVRKPEPEAGDCLLRKMEGSQVFSWEWRCGAGGIESAAREPALGVTVGV